MVGDESISFQQNSPRDADDEVVISVPFPYNTSSNSDESQHFPEPPLKIDYTAIELPAPKKTISVRRSGGQTRLVKLDKANERPTAKNSDTTDSSGSKDVAETMQKLLKNVGTLTLAAQENQRHYGSIATALEQQATAIPKLDALQKHFDQSHKVETANQRLFDVMHGELKGYKDNFLFDALQKPVIRDMLSLFDDLCGQARRVARFINENSADSDTKLSWKAELQASHDNINNTVFFIIEVLNRLDVTMVDGDDTVLDLKLHKVVGVEPTDLPEEKNLIARVVRPGFLWKDRVLRPTEVIIRKYTPAAE